MKTLHALVATAGLAMATLTLPAAALAAVGPVPNGTLNFAGTASPTVNLTAAPNTYTASNLGTVNFSGTGAFAPANGTTGTMNGNLQFSSVVGTTILETLNNFLTFTDGSGGNFGFTVSSATTQNYTASPTSTAIALYLLGTTSDPNYANTPTSVTLQFNKDASSAYSTSGSLSVPPSIAAAPEPGAWLLMMGGVGFMGMMLRSRKSRSTSLATA